MVTVLNGDYPIEDFIWIIDNQFPMLHLERRRCD